MVNSGAPNVNTPSPGQTQTTQQKTDRAKITQATIQAILASSVQESDCYSDSENNQLDIYLILNAPNDTEIPDKTKGI